jgi:hypothetical protein
VAVDDVGDIVGDWLDAHPVATIVLMSVVLGLVWRGRRRRQAPRTLPTLAELYDTDDRLAVTPPGSGARL